MQHMRLQSYRGRRKHLGRSIKALLRLYQGSIKVLLMHYQGLIKARLERDDRSYPPFVW
jgi:hypothetical protein